MSRGRSLVVAAALAAMWTGEAHGGGVVNGGFETGDLTGRTVTGAGTGVDAAFPSAGGFDAVFTAGATDADPNIPASDITGAGTLLSFLSFEGLSDSTSGIAWNLDDVSVTAGGIPEPGSRAMLLAGFALIAVALRRRPAVATA